MKEYIDKYKKELKTIDVEAIKKVIFQKVYNEVIGIEARKSAKRWYVAHPANDDSEDFDDTANKSVLKSLGGVAAGATITPRTGLKANGTTKK
jgi:hypothetical protein